MGEMNEIRISATPDDLQRWGWFLKKMEERGLIEIFSVSRDYPNRGESKLARRYFKIKLNANPPESGE